MEAIDSPVGDLLILDRVYLARPFRGLELGPALAAEAKRDELHLMQHGALWLRGRLRSSRQPLGTPDEST
ncbi:hypothetical protein AB0N97_40635 [Streptomyces collinus]|uniref:hypothetical protein n=1 Tax=Streptomyces collinus TaxID=42684 RepID=UPI003444E855